MRPDGTVPRGPGFSGVLGPRSELRLGQSGPWGNTMRSRGIREKPADVSPAVAGASPRARACGSALSPRLHGFRACPVLDMGIVSQAGAPRLRAY